MSAFLQPGNYFEAGISVLDPDVSGKEAGSSATRRDISDMGEDYFFPNAALKLQLNDKFSFGLLYDQPFGADAEYSGKNVFVSDSSNTILAQDRLDVIRANTIDTTFNGLTSDQRVGAVLQAQGVDLSSDAGKAQFAATLSAYNNNAATKAAIDTAVKQSVTERVDAGINNINGLLGKGGTKVEVDTQNLAMVLVSNK